ncbi:MAG: phospho-N-acetylmuramoyl-pentapeptide-transferase [Bacteroidota bacterium]
MHIDFMRALVAFGGALLVSILVGRPFLYALRRLRLGQQIRAEGPQSHQAKAGTPTMGGIIILTSLSVTMLALRAVRGTVAWAFFLTLGFGLIGFLDDILSVTKGRNMGLKARQKLLGQILLGGILGLYAARTGLGAGLPLPFFNGHVDLGPVLTCAVSVFVLLAASNGVNLTDGLDGLAAGAVAIAAIAQAVLAFLFGHPGHGIFLAAVAGACLGFLWFNSHPASVFMGDTGSLALGGALGATVILTGTTFFFPFTQAVFGLEALSVIIQVFFFQTVHRRVFRMSPLHHHFELGGWREEKVVVRFWLAGLFLGLIGVVGAWAVLRG